MSPGPDELAETHDDFMGKITNLFPDTWQDWVARNASQGEPLESDIVAYLKYRLHTLPQNMGYVVPEAMPRPDWNAVTKAVTWALVVELGALGIGIDSSLILPLANAAVEAARGELSLEEGDDG